VRFSGCSAPCGPWCAHSRGVYTSGVAGFTRLAPGLNIPGRNREEKHLFHLRNKPSWARKPPYLANKPDTESTRAQGRWKSLNPSGSDGKPPLRVLSRLLTVKRRVQEPPCFTGVLSKSVQKVRNPSFVGAGF